MFRSFVLGLDTVVCVSQWSVPSVNVACFSLFNYCCWDETVGRSARASNLGFTGPGVTAEGRTWLPGILSGAGWVDDVCGLSSPCISRFDGVWVANPFATHIQTCAWFQLTGIDSDSALKNWSWFRFRFQQSMATWNRFRFWFRLTRKDWFRLRNRFRFDSIGRVHDTPTHKNVKSLNKCKFWQQALL